MKPYINAWLDCHSPHITVSDRETGDLLVHYNEDDIASLFDNGVVSLDELQSSDSAIREELVISLLLFKSTQTVRQEIEDMFLNLRPHDSILKTDLNKRTFHQKLKNLLSFPNPSLHQAG